MQETPVLFLVGRSTREGIGYPLQYSWASLVAQLVKNLPAMRETWVWSLGWEDPLEKGKATVVFWPGEFHGLYNPRGHKKSETTEPFSLSLSLSWFWHMVILIVHRGITYGIPVSYRQKRTPQAIYHNTNTFWLIGYVLQKGKSFSVLRLQLYVWKPNLNFVLL